MVRAFRVLALTAAVLPIVATIGAPDPDALQRVVSGLFKNSPPEPTPTLRALAVEPLQTHEPQIPPIESDLPARQELPAVALRVEPSDFQSSRLDTPVTIQPPVEAAQRRGLLISSLYASFVTLQALDAHSTRRALNHGARESNPLIEPFAHNTAALIALKAGTAAGVLYMTDRVRRHNRVASIVIMAAANSAYATIVARNYRIAASQR